MKNKSLMAGLTTGIIMFFLAIALVNCGGMGEENGSGVGNDPDSGFDLSRSDAKALNTTIKTMPPLDSDSATARFTFTCNQKPCTYKCKLDALAWKKCKSPKTYVNLGEGTHNFKVKASNSSGASDRSPASYIWTIKLYPGSWTATSTVNAPSTRYKVTAVWTGTQMIVWGGMGSDVTDTGGVYDPAGDSWTATSMVNAPSARQDHVAVWDTANAKMIIWGGGYTTTNTGGIYDPVANSWTDTSTTNAPEAREYFTAVWTGSKMIVWGGQKGGLLNSGGVYDPSGNSWTATPTANAPSARDMQGAVWTGTEMIIWGGHEGTPANTGGRYNLSGNSWTATSINNAPVGRYNHSTVWTGSKMIVWGGAPDNVNLNTGGVYDPAANSWTPTTLTGAPAARAYLNAVWDTVNSQMIVWGGQDDNGSTNSGGRYNPAADSWTPTTIVNAPVGRTLFGAVWTGTKMIIWGGYETAQTGGAYTP